MIRLLNGDCLEVLAGMAPESIDACVTDPPYHLLSTVERFAKSGGADRKHDGDNQYGRLSGSRSPSLPRSRRRSLDRGLESNPRLRGALRGLGPRAGAEPYGCTFSNISAIQRGKSWRHVK